MAEDGHKVSLNVYDLSQGLARQLSTTFLGKAIEGIWHTGVVVYGNEYYFGGGIQHSPAGRTPYGTPVRVVDLGITHVPKELFEEYLQEISPRYTEETYSILGHNCNNFSNEVTQFLVGATIPEYILQLPSEVVNSPMGALILPMIQQLETTLRSGAVPLVPQFRPQSLAQPSQPMSTTRMDSNQYTVSTPNMNAIDTSTNNACVESNDQSSKDTHNMPEKLPNSDKTVAPAGAQKKVVNGISGDTLEDARSKVQEEITREFAAIMATGTLRASEAAALATRRVMEKHGRMNVAMQ